MAFRFLPRFCSAGGGGVSCNMGLLGHLRSSKFLSRGSVSNSSADQALPDGPMGYRSNRLKI